MFLTQKSCLTTFELYWGKLQYPIPSMPRYGTRA
ncbi:hypothetical protein, partial [Bacillus safensis]